MHAPSHQVPAHLLMPSSGLGPGNTCSSRCPEVLTHWKPTCQSDSLSDVPTTDLQSGSQEAARPDTLCISAPWAALQLPQLRMSRWASTGRALAHSPPGLLRPHVNQLLNLGHYCAVQAGNEPGPRSCGEAHWAEDRALPLPPLLLI